MSNLEENPTGRRFLPTQADSQPSDLFKNISATIEPNAPVRFERKTDAQEFLMFISGVCKTVGAAPNRAVYAYVWGPHVNGKDKDNHEVGDLDRTLDPQTAERAQLQAAIKALKKAMDWKLKYMELSNMGNNAPNDGKAPSDGGSWVPRKVVIAFDGEYFLNQVARSTYELEEKAGNANLDLKKQVEASITSLKKEDITVQFWQLDECNFAEKYALARLR